MDILTLSLITSLVCIGITVATQVDMILEKPKEIIVGLLPSYIHKPLISCTYCMSSLWSVLVHILLHIQGSLEFDILILIVCIPITCAFNYIIVKKLG